jgi:hypothetical protein
MTDTSTHVTEKEMLEWAWEVVEIVKKHTTDSGTGIDVLKAAIAVYGGGLLASQDRREYRQAPASEVGLSGQGF